MVFFSSADACPEYTTSRSLVFSRMPAPPHVESRHTAGAVRVASVVFACEYGSCAMPRRHSREDESFEAGPATATAIASTALRGKTTDAHQWLVEITLVEK